MKKLLKSILCLVFALALTFGLTACTEWTPEGSGPTKTKAQGVGIGLGNQNAIIEVIVVVDGFSNPVKVQFDEIFSVSDVSGNTAISGDSETVTIGEKKYFKYLHIGDKYFMADSTTANLYKQIGGDGAIMDLVAYCKTTEGIQWYYDSFIAQKMQVCKEDADGTQVGDVKLADAAAFNTTNGSMRKRYSKYWNSQGYLGNSALGFNGNMDMLENYLLTYGFDNIGDLKKPHTDGNDSGYNVIGGITTGATLSGPTASYLEVAKAAYEQALSKQTNLK